MEYACDVCGKKEQEIDKQVWRNMNTQIQEEGTGYSFYFSVSFYVCLRLLTHTHKYLGEKIKSCNKE